MKQRLTCRCRKVQRSLVAVVVAVVIGVAWVGPVAAQGDHNEGSAEWVSPEPVQTNVAHTPARKAYHEHARQTITDVLADDEFANLSPNEDQWLREMSEKLRDMFRSMGDRFDQLPVWVHKVIIAWMIITLAAVLAHLIYTLWQSLRRESVAVSLDLSATGDKKKALELLGVRELDYESVLRRARELLSAGDLEAAVRYFYAAAILYLDRQGRVRFAPAKTNRDYLRELPMGDPALEPLRAMTRQFEASVFGRRPVDEHATQTMAHALDEIHQPARSTHAQSSAQGGHASQEFTR